MSDPSAGRLQEGAPAIPIHVVMPVFNDWESATRVVEMLDELARPDLPIAGVLLIDDGSNTRWHPWSDRLSALNRVGPVEVLELVCNVGHQRALALGLAQLAQLRTNGIVVTMDADGEDRPSDAFILAGQSVRRPDAIVVARRSGRQEGLLHRVMYVAYKWLFRLLTGQRLEFGNFMAIPAEYVVRLVGMPQLWNHYAATVLRSRIPLEQLPIRKGGRLAGRSHMSFSSLVAHGLAAVSVFADVAFARVLILSALGAVLSLLGVAVAIGIRLFTTLAIPGWATLAVGIGVLVALQAIMLCVTSAFILLHQRMVIGPPFASVYEGFIRGTVSLSAPRSGE